MAAPSSREWGVREACGDYRNEIHADPRQSVALTPHKVHRVSSVKIEWNE